MVDKTVKKKTIDICALATIYLECPAVCFIGITTEKKHHQRQLWKLLQEGKITCETMKTILNRQDTPKNIVTILKK